MPDVRIPEKALPFAALLGVSSLLAALLYLGGFAYRWSYFYNFGVQHIVFRLGAQSFLIASFEVARSSAGQLHLVLWVLLPIVAFNALLAGFRRLADGEGRGARAAAFTLRGSGLSSPLTVDLVRAAILLFGTYAVASTAGYQTFRAHAADGPANPLPAVTILLDDAAKLGPLRVLACGAIDAAPAPLSFIGDGDRLRALMRDLRTCGGPDSRWTWRLLYRDDQEVFVFAATAADLKAGDVRPLTLAVPANPPLILQ